MLQDRAEPTPGDQPTPIAHFILPSATSGADYAEQAGNAWDLSESSDVVSLKNFASASISGGVLDLVTNNGQGDPQIRFNTPASFDPASYRYLTFRMYTEAAWQNVPQGMITRLIWTIRGLTGRQGAECSLVSQDLPIRCRLAGNFTIDLYDSFAGSVEQTSPGPPNCPSLPFNWINSPSAIKFRLDPNENIGLGNLHQIIDWVKLPSLPAFARVIRCLSKFSLIKIPKQ